MASDMKYMDVFRDPLWLLHNLYGKYKVIRSPTNAGRVTSHVPTGGGGGRLYDLYVDTGVGANSRGMWWQFVTGLNSGNLASHRIDWTKRLELSFIVVRTASDVQVRAGVQLKESNTEGILAERGIGVSIDNFSMNGEAYGTARGTVPIGTLASNQSARIRIVLTASAVEFWVNGVLVGTLTGTAVPNVVGAVDAYEVESIINGAAGGVDAFLFVSNIEIVQEW